MDNNEEKLLKQIHKNLENKKAIRLNDSAKTVIYINKQANEEKAVKKYLKDLEEYKFANLLSYARSPHLTNKKKS